VSWSQVASAAWGGNQLLGACTPRAALSHS